MDDQPLNMPMLMSAEELLAYRKKTDSVLPEGSGCKSYLRFEADSQVDTLLQERKEFITDKTAAIWKDLVIADWSPSLQRAVVRKDKGKCFQYMGTKIKEKTALYPEEAGFLAEIGTLEVYYKNKPLSKEEIYDFMTNRVSLEKFSTYSFLTHLGYIVVRHQGRLKATASGNKKSSDQHVSERNRNKRKVRNNNSESEPLSKSSKNEKIRIAKDEAKSANSDVINSSVEECISVKDNSVEKSTSELANNILKELESNKKLCSSIELDSNNVSDATEKVDPNKVCCNNDDDSSRGGHVNDIIRECRDKNEISEESVSDNSNFNREANFVESVELSNESHKVKHNTEASNIYNDSSSSSCIEQNSDYILCIDITHEPPVENIEHITKSKTVEIIDLSSDDEYVNSHYDKIINEHDNLDHIADEGEEIIEVSTCIPTDLQVSFPNIADKNVLHLRKPPAHLIPKNVVPANEIYVIDIDKLTNYENSTKWWKAQKRYQRSRVCRRKEMSYQQSHNYGFWSCFQKSTDERQRERSSLNYSEKMRDSSSRLGFLQQRPKATNDYIPNDSSTSFFRERFRETHLSHSPLHFQKSNDNWSEKQGHSESSSQRYDTLDHYIPHDKNLINNSLTGNMYTHNQQRTLAMDSSVKSYGGPHFITESNHSLHQPNCQENFPSNNQYFNYNERSFNCRASLIQSHISNQSHLQQFSNINEREVAFNNCNYNSNYSHQQTSSFHSSSYNENNFYQRNSNALLNEDPKRNSRFSPPGNFRHKERHKQNYSHRRERKHANAHSRKSWNEGSNYKYSSIPSLNVTTYSWKQYKKEMIKQKQRNEAKLTDGSSLWKGKYHPLVKPSYDVSAASLQKQLKIVESISLLKYLNRFKDRTSKNSLEISYDVYLPGTVYKKSCPELPHLRIVVIRVSDKFSHLNENYKKLYMDDHVPLYFAVVDHADISFFSFKDGNLPIQISLM